LKNGKKKDFADSHRHNSVIFVFIQIILVCLVLSAAAGKMESEP
jgi:hypothetical protein